MISAGKIVLQPLGGSGPVSNSGVYSSDANQGGQTTAEGNMLTPSALQNAHATWVRAYASQTPNFNIFLSAAASGPRSEDAPRNPDPVEGRGRGRRGVGEAPNTIGGSAGGGEEDLSRGPSSTGSTNGVRGFLEGDGRGGSGGSDLFRVASQWIWENKETIALTLLAGALTGGIAYAVGGIRLGAFVFATVR